MNREEQDEVERLLKHIFDPSETVFAGRPFVHRWANGRTMDPIKNDDSCSNDLQEQSCSPISS
jgi:hypothetical protein